MVLGVKYLGGISTLQRFTSDSVSPVWSDYPASGACAVVGRITALAIGYSATTDRIRVVGVGDAGRVLRYDEGTNTCMSSTIGTANLTAVTAGNAPDLTQLGVFAAGSAGSLWASTNGGSSWSLVVPGNPYTKWGFQGTTFPSPDLTGIATFPSGFSGRFGVLVGKRPSGYPGVGSLYHMADLTVPVVESPSSNVFSDLTAVAGTDPTHYWAVGSGGTVLRSEKGTVSGSSWLAPTGVGNGFFAKLSCAVATPGVSCDDPGSNYGMGIEPLSGVKPSTLTGQVWIGLADSFGTYGLSDVRPPLQSSHEFFGPNGIYSGFPVMDSANGNEQNRPTEIAVAGNYLFVGARIGTPAGMGNFAYQPMERETIAADGSLSPPGSPSNCTLGAGAQDIADSKGFYRLAATASGGTNWIHMVTPPSPAFGGQLRIRTADSAGDWCTDLTLDAITNNLTTPNGCTYDSARGDFEAIGDGANLYVIGGHCSNKVCSNNTNLVCTQDSNCGVGNSCVNKIDTNTILRLPVNASGSAGPAVLNTATLPAGFGRVNLTASIADSGAAKSLVVFDPVGNQIAVGRINRSNNEACTGVTGTVCTLTVQTTNPLPTATPAANPSAVGVAGTFLLAVYPRPANFDNGSLRGHSVLAAPIRFDVEPVSAVGGWTAAEDRSVTAYPPGRVTTWKSGTRTVAYLGPYLDDRLWATVDRYDTEVVPNAPGWLSFDLIDNLNPDTGLVETPPVRTADCLKWADQSVTIGERGISYANTSSASLVYDCGGGKIDTIRPGEVWGWARFLGLKRAGELRSPAETDWGWLSLRGPAVTNVQDYTKFSCFRCDVNTSSCDICQSSNAKTETPPAPQPTCSQCSGCTFGATKTCTACAVCRQYGVSYDRGTGDFHGYAWSGGRSNISGGAAGRIAVVTDTAGASWLKTLVQNDPALSANATYYTQAQFAAFLTAHASNPFKLVVVDDPHLTAAQLSQLESSVVALGASVYATEEVRESSGGSRYSFAGAVLCQGTTGGCEFTGSGIGATVNAADHSPLGVKAGDILEDPPVGSRPGVLANSTGNGGTVNPVVDAPYNVGSIFGAIAELAHWNYGMGTVYYFADTADGVNPTDCSTVACINFGSGFDFAATGAFHTESVRSLASHTAIGLGWISFEQGITGSQKFSSFVQAQYGDIYSGGNIVSSRGATPFGEFGICNAFVIQTAGSTISSLCSGLAGYEAQCANPANANQASNCGNPQAGSNSSTFNPGVVTNSTIQPFPQFRNDFSAPLGKLDVVGLRTVTKIVGLTKYNKYGIEVKQMTEAEFVSAFAAPAGGVLGGKVYVVSPSAPTYVFYPSQPLQFNNGGSGVSGAGLIIVEGTLYLEQNVTYATATVSRLSQIASAGWIVVTNPLVPGTIAASLYVAAPVTLVSGTFYVGTDVISLGYGGSQEDSQLLFHGPVMARQFTLDRNTIGGAGSPAQGAEVFIDDGRLRLNPPPGFEDIATTLPVYR
jgi:hypothetical protein